MNKFNLVDEPWIPVAGNGLKSLSEVFANSELPGLGGNPVEKIALTKLLLAIAQAAYTPKDEADWLQLGSAGMAEKALEYLNKKRELFWLYGDKPFLQMPTISAAEKVGFGAIQPHIAYGNTTVLTQSQQEIPLSDAAKSLLLVQLMGFGLGGKKTDNRVVLSPSYQGKCNDKGKPSTGKPGPSVGFLGFLHSFMQGSSLHSTLWLNLLTETDLADFKVFTYNVGIPPWEAMPAGEDCAAAKRLKSSYMGRLVPLSRFMMLADDGIHYSEGIAHQDYKDGIADVSITVDMSGSKPLAVWADPDKRPWRQLQSLLSFLGNERTFDCPQLRIGIAHAKHSSLADVGIWVGGLRVSSNAGEQYVSGQNDFVESEISFHTSYFGDYWFKTFSAEMQTLQELSKTIYACTLSYYKAQKADGKKLAAQAAGLFWQLCEPEAQALVEACAQEAPSTALPGMRKAFAAMAEKAYNTYCPHDTARQLDAWASARPSLGKYLAKI